MKDHSAVLLETHIERAVEDFVAKVDGSYSPYRIYCGGNPERYDVTEETPSDRSVIVVRQSDGKKFKVHTQVFVEEYTA